MNAEVLLRDIPSVDSLLKSEEAVRWLSEYPRTIVVNVIRESLSFLREEIRKGLFKERESLRSYLIFLIERGLERASELSLRPLINATGVVIHTNLGRSVLSAKATMNLIQIARSYSNLEYDLIEGKRGKRYVHLVRLLKEVTGAEDVFVVNNNAAAVFITLNSLASGREVIVSRGELVEIGGSFRMPDVMRMSGAVLREVGTTNKTHLYDYERAINENTALIMKVHRSNFKISGFVQEVSASELLELGRSRGIPVVFDLGSGCLIDLRKYGIPEEPSVQEILKTGVDIVTFSGDKLLGGPQAGVILGKRELIERIRKSPLARVVRVDKFTIAALEATLYEYLDEERAIENIPTLRMLLEKPESIRKRAEALIKKLQRIDGFKRLKRPEESESISEDILKNINALLFLEEDYSRAGGGSLPEVELKTWGVSVKPLKVSCNLLEERLRNSDPPLIARIKDNRLFLDARTIQEHEIDSVTKIMGGIFS
ncbi:MAG: L-seryl-tRNA(Sec) selenium transferase [Thermodesulfovibrionales bacterium]|nr:L-seryl-tRNA(Sec) selenium transferase [Thermodesulfovibrionales bacterium]